MLKRHFLAGSELASSATLNHHFSRPMRPKKGIFAIILAAFFALFTITSNAEELSIAPTNEAPIDEPLTPPSYQHIAPTLTTSGAPQKAYIYEPFSIKIKADTGLDIGLDAIIEVRGEHIKWLNQKPLITQKNSIFETSLNLIATSHDATLNYIKITFLRNGEFFATATATARLPKITSLADTPKSFTNILATSLTASKVRTSPYDDNSNIINFELTAQDADLTLFEIPLPPQLGQPRATTANDSPHTDTATIATANSPHAEQTAPKTQGINSLKSTKNSQIASYFVILPAEQNSLDLSYFNTQKMAFETITLAITPDSSTLSTQVGLNPQEGDYAYYKELALYALIAICALVFLLWRNYTALIIGILVAAYVIYASKPLNTEHLAPQSHIKILPMNSSTTFKITKENEPIKVLDTHKEWVKVLFETGEIGWVLKTSIEP